MDTSLQTQRHRIYDIASRKMEPNHKLIIMALLWAQSESSPPSVHMLMWLSGLSKRTVYRKLDELVELGWILKIKKAGVLAPFYRVQMSKIKIDAPEMRGQR